MKIINTTIKAPSATALGLPFSSWARKKSAHKQTCEHTPFVLLAGEEKLTHLFNVQTDEDVLHRLREEQTSCIIGLLELPQEEILVQLIEQEESCAGQTIDNG